MKYDVQEGVLYEITSPLATHSVSSSKGFVELIYYIIYK
jgi:hypothetical protein